MADFTPYGYTDKNRQKALDRFNANWVSPTWQRATTDWDKLESSMYDRLASKITQQKNTAESQFWNRMRRTGMGDSPVSEKLWGTRYEPGFTQNYLDAASQALTSRTSAENADLQLWNQANLTGTLARDTGLFNYLQQAFNNDLSQWNTNTASGFQNRALSQARSANEGNWLTSLMGMLGQGPAAFMNIAKGGQMMDLWGSGGSGGSAASGFASLGGEGMASGGSMAATEGANAVMDLPFFM